ncbi:MAG: Ku protein [Rhodospirillaceae bacterium]|nr:Ku protein [Rhodospirillaceae bacterium]
MAPRANWKGHLKLGFLSCPVALYTAASEGDRISFHTLNRKTGHRVLRKFVDSETGKPVEREDQVKGYEVGKGDYVVLTTEDIEEAIPESTKTIEIDAFVLDEEMDEVFIDNPYYLAPTEPTGQEVFALIRKAMTEKKVIGIARTVLFRRSRILLLRPTGPGLTASTLHFDYEVRSADEVFSDVSRQTLSKEMVDLAKHIISTKRGKFEPGKLDDRYEGALAELIKAKQQGKEIKVPPKPAHGGNVVDLLDALRKSAGKRSGHAEPRSAASRKRKAARRAMPAPRKKAS